VLGAKHIDKNNKLDLSDPTYLSREKYEESPEIMVKEGDVLIVQRGTLGKVLILDKEIGEATINPSMVILKELKISNFFLYYFLCSHYGQKLIDVDNSATGVPMISQKQISEFRISLPPVPEQRKIASILSEVDQKIEEENTNLKELQNLKKGLMQVLLTGKVRVTLD